MTFYQARRERFLNEKSYAAFVRGSRLELIDVEQLLVTELPQLPHDDPAFKQWNSEVLLRRVEMLVGRYSAGDAISGIATEFPSVLNAAEMLGLPHSHYSTEPFYLDELDTYTYAMWLLSLCKLLRLDPLLPRVMALFDVAREDNRGKDALFETLVAKLGGEAVAVTPAGNLLKNLKAHPLLLRAIEADPKKRPLLMAEFLKKWYPAMKGCYWYNRHDKVPQNFFGYWAFEAGLVTYLWDIDDAGYRDLPFYPKDLVDYARAHPEVNELALEAAVPADQRPSSTHAGQPCPRTGFWFTPAKPGSRQHFTQGQVMPSVGGDYGLTIWQWDAQQ